MRAVAYLRVSSASQVDGHSLNAQERLFRELCKNRRWEAVGVYREEGISNSLGCLGIQVAVGVKQQWLYPGSSYRTEATAYAVRQGLA